MTACDECWNRAFGIARATGQHQVDVYRKLIAENPEHDEEEASGVDVPSL